MEKEELQDLLSEAEFDFGELASKYYKLEEENQKLKVVVNYVAGKFVTMSMVRQLGGWKTVDEVRKLLGSNPDA